MPDRYFADLTGEPWISSLEDWAVKSETYKCRVIGLNMWSIDGWGIVYNSEIYSRLGLRVPRNYAEFVSNCERILAAGITPIYEPGRDTWHGCLWLLSIADFVNRKHPGLYDRLNTINGKFTDIPEALTLTEQYKELETRGFFGRNYMSQNFDGGAEALASGRFAHFLTYTAWANENSPNFPNARMNDWGMFPVPLAGNNTFSHSGGGILTVINKESKNIEEAKAYFRFLTRKENAQRYYTAKPKLATSSIKGVTVAPLKAMDDIIANSTGGIGPDFAASIPFYNADDVGRPYRELLLGTKTPLEVLQTIDATRRSMFEVTGF
jgi:raffinose/stachyose/melibiose transport system substrate-binding protein